MHRTQRVITQFPDIRIILRAQVSKRWRRIQLAAVVGTWHADVSEKRRLTHAAVKSVGRMKSRAQGRALNGLLCHTAHAT